MDRWMRSLVDNVCCSDELMVTVQFVASSWLKDYDSEERPTLSQLERPEELNEDGSDSSACLNNYAGRKSSFFTLW